MSLVGQKIDGYHVQSELGKGGMGVVYKASGRGRTVVIKAMLPEVAKDDRAKQRFMREAEVLKGLSDPAHKNIVTVYGYGAVPPRREIFYIIMEYVDGGDLEKYSQTHVLRVADMLAILEQVAGALDYVHARDIVHRDLKPQNVLMMASGTPKLSDFGLARVDDQRGISRYGDRMTGTLIYMAPEQFSTSRVEAPADRYAFAVMSYYLLLGAFPYPLEQMQNEGLLFQWIAVNSPLPATSRNPNLPRSVDDVFFVGLAKSPDERYRSCMEFVRDLSRAYRGQDLVALPSIVNAAGGLGGEGVSAHEVDTWSASGKIRDAQQAAEVLTVAALLFGIAVADAGIRMIGRSVAERLDLREQVRVYYTIAEVLSAELSIPIAEAFLLVLQLTSDEGEVILKKIPRQFELPTVSVSLDAARRVLLRVQVTYKYESAFADVECETEIYYLASGAPKRRIVTDTLKWERLPFDIRENFIRKRENVQFKVYPGA